MIRRGGTRTLVPRDFRSVPTFGHATNQFVWARPKGAVDSEAELAIERQARAVLERYRGLRARFIGEGKPGAVALMREAVQTADRASRAIRPGPMTADRIGLGRPRSMVEPEEAGKPAVGREPTRANADPPD